MPGLLIRQVSYAEILSTPNAQDLLEQYAQECSIPEIGRANPQAEMYRQMEATGMFQAFGLFYAEQLRGFASLLCYTLPHYGRKIANVESLFITQKHRKNGAGNLLMNAVEQYAKDNGCEVILYNARAGSQLEKLLSLLRPYQRTNSVFLRSLRPPQT
jgi:GNAT superfamily N-acetyltransferase